MAGAVTNKTEPIIALHGFGVRGWFFDPLKPLFSPDTPLYFPDLTGPTIQERVNQAVALVKTCIIDHNRTPVLIGHSLGGVISAITAHQCAGSVAALILIATPSTGRRGSRISRELQKILVKRHLVPENMARPMFFSSLTNPKVVDHFFERVVPEPSSLIDEIFQPTSPHTMILSKIRTPTLCIGSLKDATVPIEDIKEIAHRILNAELMVVEELNHSELIHGPEEYTGPIFSKIQAFITQHS